MNDKTTALMKLDDETMMTVAGGLRRVCAPKHKKYSYVRQENTQTFTAGDISLSVGGDLSGDVFIGNAASNSVGSEPA